MGSQGALKNSMLSLTDKRLRRKTCLVFATLLLPLFFLKADSVQAQMAVPGSSNQPRDLFRLETRQVEGGAELITISAQLSGHVTAGPDSGSGAGQPPAVDRWIPLVAVLRDTLGDDNPDNDRLRYVWALTYTRPSMRQRAASAVPFLYTRIGNKQSSAKEPPPLMELSAADREVWHKIFRHALQIIVLDPVGIPVRASSRTYLRNIDDYRKSHVIRALSVLALYQTLKEEQIFSDTELQEIQARLLLTDKTFGGIVDDQHLSSYYRKATTKIRDNRSRNWELLRQQAEAGGLYFEPLEMPDGSATHALLWMTPADIEARAKQRFDGRFLNIANPWTDKRLPNWKGYSETRYVDADNRPVSAGSTRRSRREDDPAGLVWFG